MVVLQVVLVAVLSQAPQYIQSNCNTTASSTTAVTVNLPGVQQGDLIVVSANFDNNFGATNPMSPADTLGTAYAPVVPQVEFGVVNTGLWYGIAPGGGSDDITVTLLGAGKRVAVVGAEYTDAGPLTATVDEQGSTTNPTTLTYALPAAGTIAGQMLGGDTAAPPLFGRLTCGTQHELYVDGVVPDSGSTSFSFTNSYAYWRFAAAVFGGAADGGGFGPIDAGTDAGTDAGFDAGSDGGSGAGPDGGGGAASDAGIDGGVDAGPVGLALRVGCDCSSTPGAVFMTVALMLLVSRARNRRAA